MLCICATCRAVTEGETIRFLNRALEDKVIVGEGDVFDDVNSDKLRVVSTEHLQTPNYGPARKAALQKTLELQGAEINCCNDHCKNDPDCQCWMCLQYYKTNILGTQQVM